MIKKMICSVVATLTLLISIGGTPISATEQSNEMKNVEYVKVDQELVDKAKELEYKIDKYVTVTDEGLLQLDPVVEDKYGKELYKFFLYGVYMNNDRIVKGELVASNNGVLSNQNGLQNDIDAPIMAASGCSWSNYGKSLIGGATTGAITGGVSGAVAGGVGAGPGAAVGAIGGFAAGGVKYFGTCWW